jgi:Tol biopolymer transport system component
MKQLNGYRMRLVAVGIVAAIIVGSGRAKADFTFGETTNLGLPVNTPSDEQSPSISANGLELYFQSRRPGGYGNWDIWVAKRASLDDPWGEPVNLGPLVNNSVGNWSHGISADGLQLYFEANRSGNYGGVDLWVALRETKDEPWGDPVNLGPTINSPDYEGYPSLSADGLAMFFNSNRFNGARGWDFDIWLTRRKTKDSAWGEPINLGPDINTTHFEVAPSISADGHTLYFSDWYATSTIRPDGCGGADLYKASVIPIVDLNGDGIVDSADMIIMVDHWGTDNSLCDIGPMPWGDGVVDVEDLIVLAEHLFEELPGRPIQP